jgi:uncharacterized membrane protein YhhN
MATLVLTLAALASAALHIWAEYHGPTVQVYVCKPLTMGLIIVIAAMRTKAGRGVYALGILGGLLCSAAGDVFLMLPDDRFIPGLVSFLIGHLCYIAAFTYGRPFRVTLWPLAAFASYGVLIFLMLLPRLGSVTVPVALYIAVILAMGWQAWERRAALGTSGAALALAGAILFIVSDSILALNRFHTPLQLGRLLNLSTYFIAQWCMAMSIGRRNEE